MTRNLCSEDLLSSSSLWLRIIPQAIPFTDLGHYHVRSMNFIFGDAEYLKHCKDNVYDMVRIFSRVVQVYCNNRCILFKLLRKIQTNFAVIEPRAFIALIQLLEKHKEVKSEVSKEKQLIFK